MVYCFSENIYKDLIGFYLGGLGLGILDSCIVTEELAYG